MKVVVSDLQIKKAIYLVRERSGDEKRILSPKPGIEPYWYHLVRVYAYLVESGETDQNILLAAILHDSVEDNQVKLEEISEMFGQKVRDIVSLISEDVHTDHKFSGNRDGYFQRIRNYPDSYTRLAVMKIKTVDRYDNLIGLSYTDLEKKKQQYLSEIDNHIRDFAREVELEELIDKGINVLKRETAAPDIDLELVMPA